MSDPAKLDLKNPIRRDVFDDPGWIHQHLKFLETSYELTEEERGRLEQARIQAQRVMET